MYWCSPLGQISVQGTHILTWFSSTSILLLGQARTQELRSTTKLSGGDHRGTFWKHHPKFTWSLFECNLHFTQWRLLSTSLTWTFLDAERSVCVSDFRIVLQLEGRWVVDERLRTLSHTSAAVVKASTSLHLKTRTKAHNQEVKGHWGLD